MAYQDPSFSFVHAIRDEITSISDIATNSHVLPREYMFDDLAGTFFNYAASNTIDINTDFDRGSGTRTPINRLIIPKNHNFTTGPVTIYIHTDDNSSFSSPTTQVPDVSITSSSLIDKDFASDDTQRYVRLHIFKLGESLNPSYSQLIFTYKNQLSRGPEPGWDQPIVDNTLIYRSPAGVESSRVLGADRQQFRMTWRNLDTTDLAVLNDLWTTCGTHSVFYFDPPDDSIGVLPMRLTRPISRRQDFNVPGVKLTFSYTLEMMEAIG